MGWRTKSIAQVQSEFDRGELKRSLGAIHLVLFGIGCIIGAGIFVRTGTAAALYAGPAVMLSFIIAGVVCVFAGLCYAELASMLPVSGSAYTYAYTTVGEFGAWIMGALLLLEYALAASVVAVGWSGLRSQSAARHRAQHSGRVHAGRRQTRRCACFDFQHDRPARQPEWRHGDSSPTVRWCSSSRRARRPSTGAFTTALAQNDVVDAAKAGGYALINSLDIAVKTDSQALLAEATKVMDPATAHLRDLAAGTQLVVPERADRAVAAVHRGSRGSRVGRDFAVQSAGGVHHAVGHHAADPRRVRVRHGQQHHRGHQGHGDPGVHRGGRILREPRQLASVHSRAHGRRESIRHQRCDSCRDDRVLCLHRFRGRLDRRSGSEESAQGHAHRHPGFADHLHRALHGHRSGAHGRGVVHQAQRRRTRGHRGRHLRSAMGLARQVHQDWRHRRPVVGGAGADVRPDPRVLLHVARWPAAEDARESASEVQDAMDQHASSSACWFRWPQRCSTSTSSAT